MEFIILSILAGIFVLGVQRQSKILMGIAIVGVLFFGFGTVFTALPVIIAAVWFARQYDQAPEPSYDDQYAHDQYEEYGYNPQPEDNRF